MVRRTTAQVKSTTTATKKLPTDTAKIDFEGLYKKFIDGMGENWITYAWFVLVILGVFQLRQFIFGIWMLTIGILMIAGFFGDNTK